MEKVTSIPSELPPDVVRNASQCFLEEGWPARHSRVSQEADLVGGTGVLQVIQRASRTDSLAPRKRVCVLEHCW